jgi:Sulfotransferase family
MNTMDLRVDEPVIVLTCGRSGSTLLRFILDAHPKLACPPETHIADLCAQMGTTWKLLEGPAAAARPGLSDLAAKSVRNWVTTVFGTYLIQAGKSRWCEKSIGAADSAGRFLTLFPKTKFICLYRDCLDVIDSVLEACPFGLRGYGLEQFAAAHVGNSVAAVADYWGMHTRTITDFEQQHADRCIRVRYEDLVADPDAESARVFTFLGEASAPGIAGASLLAGRVPFGPSDHKVWTTAGISGDSVGRGARLPVQAIPAGVRALLDNLLEQLGYPRLASGPGRSARPGPAGQPEIASVGQLEKLLAQRVTGEPAAGPASALPPVGDFCLTVTLPPGPPGSSASRTWRIDPEYRTMERVDARLGATAGWEITGDVATWTSVLTGQANLATMMRHGHLRYTDVPEGDPGGPPFGDRVPLLAAMLLPAPERAGAAGPAA